jgi:hypothetical protein
MRGDGTGDDVAEDIIARSESYKMDVQDFVDAVEIDDVLIQVIMLKPRTRMMKVMKDTIENTNSDNAEKASLLSNIMKTGDTGDGSGGGVDAQDSLMGQRFSQVLSDALGSTRSSRPRTSSNASNK